MSSTDTRTSQAPAFAAGDWVIYRGSVLRYSGWAMRVTNVWPDGAYSLCDDVWGVRLYGVRPTSVTDDPLGA